MSGIRPTPRAPQRKKAVHPVKPPALAPLETRRQELIGCDEDGNMSLWDTGNVRPLTAFEPHNPPWMIDSGHYVIEWKGHAITVHLGNATGGRITVLFMCSGAGYLYMPREVVEPMLLGKVIPDPEHEARMAEGFKKLTEAMCASNHAPHRRRGRIQ
jgi:hypothetical protein